MRGFEMFTVASALGALSSSNGFLSPVRTPKVSPTGGGAPRNHHVMAAKMNAVEEKLMVIARNLKLQVYDIDDAIYGYEPIDLHYGIEVVKTNVKIDPSLGLELTEMARGDSGQGLVLISAVSGNSVEASPAIQVGDAITGVLAGSTFKERTIGVDYDCTVAAISQAKGHATNGYVTLQLNRLVPKAKVTVEVNDGQKVHTLNALAGENLRTLLIRKRMQLYDPKTKRFDQPFSTGDCSGEGICGTCLVSVDQGHESLNDKTDLEAFITRGRPTKWRAACRTIVGADNKEGFIRIRTHPQTGHEEELDPGVKDVRLDAQ